MNVKLGPLPLYVIDILILITLLYALRARTPNRGIFPFSGIIVVIGIFMVVSELSAIVVYGSPLQPIYMLGRSLLALSLFYSASHLIRSEADVQRVMKAGLLGLLVTASLMVLTSLPFTRGIVTGYIFSIPFLEPASEQSVRLYEQAVGATRGRSLVGVSILSGAFINAFWPLVSVLYRWPGHIRLWKRLALVGVVVAPFGVVMSYSRGAVIGLILVVGAIVFFGSGKSRRGVVIAVVFGLATFSYVGWQSDNFYFERLQKRTQIMLENPYKDAEETERLYAYSEPFSHLIEHPWFLILGEGTSIGKIAGAESEAAGMANHAVFAQAYYSYGLIAALIYLVLIISGFSYLWNQVRRRVGEGKIPELYAQALLAGLAGMLPWFVFGHAAISTPRGASLLFLYFGMIAALENFRVENRSPATVG